MGAEWAMAKGRGNVREGAGGISCGTLWTVTRTLSLSSRVTQSCGRVWSRTGARSVI